MRLQEFYVKGFDYYFDLIISIQKTLRYCGGEFGHSFEQAIFILCELYKQSDDFESEVFTGFREGRFVDSLNERRNEYFVCGFGIIFCLLDQLFDYFKCDFAVGLDFVVDGSGKEGG